MNQTPKLDLRLDLVHHNPGEPPFTSRFTDPSFLAQLGYTGQVLKHANCLVSLDELSPEIFPAASDSRAWLDTHASAFGRDVDAAKAAGLQVFSHVDLIVLPKRLVELQGKLLADPVTGGLTFRAPGMRKVLRALFDEVFERFSGLDGLMVRLGETYLFDTPHHTGTGAVPLHHPGVSRSQQMVRFAELLNFLRTEICRRHGRWLIHRTWDYFGDRFHADPAFYRRVTNAVAPHPRLVFSIKHTAGDFFRGCLPNPCLGLGHHPQVVEVECQREYEGKGAFPNYVGRGVIDGFPEVPVPRGLRHWRKTRQWAGVFTWSRGGGWFGPYLKHEFWCEFNARVVTTWSQHPDRSEEDVFHDVCTSSYGMNESSRVKFRDLCLRAEEAVWLGRSSAVMAELTDFTRADAVELWTRDDCLGGLDQLHPVFTLLHEAGRLPEALKEKQRAAALFADVKRLSTGVQCADPAATHALRASAKYGAALFAVIAEAWQLMARRWLADHKHSRVQVTPADLARYRRLWKAYRDLPRKHPLCASLYQPHYWNWPGQPPMPGMDASVLGRR